MQSNPNFRVESDVPLPGQRVGASAKYPFGEMEIGDSFEAPNNQSIRRAACAYDARNNKRFVCRITERGGDTMRIWRFA